MAVPPPPTYEHFDNKDANDDESYTDIISEIKNIIATDYAESKKREQQRLVEIDAWYTDEINKLTNERNKRLQYLRTEIDGEIFRKGQNYRLALGRARIGWIDWMRVWKKY
jgi:hypothetical protein